MVSVVVGSSQVAQSLRFPMSRPLGTSDVWLGIHQSCNFRVERQESDGRPEAVEIPECKHVVTIRSGWRWHRDGISVAHTRSNPIRANVKGYLIRFRVPFPSLEHFVKLSTLPFPASDTSGKYAVRSLDSEMLQS